VPIAPIFPAQKQLRTQIHFNPVVRGVNPGAQYISLAISKYFA
jgi:hypothetical protein